MPNIFLGIFKTILTGFNPRLISQIYDLDHYEYHTVAPVGSDLHNKQSLSPNTIDFTEHSSSRAWNDINGTDILNQITTLFVDIESEDNIPTNNLTSNIYVMDAGDLIAYANNISYFFIGGSGNELYSRAVSPAFFYDNKIAVITATSEDVDGSLSVSRWESDYIVNSEAVELVKTDTVDFPGISGNTKHQITLNLDASKCAIMNSIDGYVVSDINSTVFTPTILKYTDIPEPAIETLVGDRTGGRVYDYCDQMQYIAICSHFLDINCATWANCNDEGKWDYNIRNTEELIDSEITNTTNYGTDAGTLLAFGYDIETDTINLLVERYGTTSKNEITEITETTTYKKATSAFCYASQLDENSSIYSSAQNRTITATSLNRLEFYSGITDGYIGNPIGGSVIKTAEYEYSYARNQDIETQDNVEVINTTTRDYLLTEGTVSVSDIIDISNGLFAITYNMDSWTMTEHTETVNKYFYDGKRSTLIDTFDSIDVSSFASTPDEIDWGTETNYNKTNAPAVPTINPSCSGCKTMPYCPGFGPTCDYNMNKTFNFNGNIGNSFPDALGCYVETWDYE